MPHRDETARTDNSPLLLDQGLLAQPIDYEAAFDLSFVQAFYSE